MPRVPEAPRRELDELRLGLDGHRHDPIVEDIQVLATRTMRRPRLLDRGRSLVAGDPGDQATDPQPLERAERVERHWHQPDRAAQADRVRAGPEELAAV